MYFIFQKTIPKRKMFGLRLTQRIGKLSTTALTTKQTINSFTMVRSMSSNTNKTQLTQTKWNSLSQVRGFAHRSTIDGNHDFFATRSVILISIFEMKWEWKIQI